ncbi:putative reverse transcriptase domain-containing protein [Tanacetum coccineum]
MSIRTQAPTPFLSEEVAERVLALPTPPPSPLSPYSSPLPQIPSPPLPIPPPSPISPTYAEGSLGSRAAGIRQRDALPVHETEIPEMWLPLRKRLCRTTPGPRCEVGESSAAGAARQFGPTTAEADLYGFTDMLEAAPGRQMSRELGYGIRDTWDDLVGAIQEIAPTTLEGVNQRVIELSSAVDQEDEIIYSHLDDARYDRALLRARVNRLDSDRPFHRRTALLIEEEARLSRAAWARSMDTCDQVHSEGMSLRTTVMAQQSEIVELRAADQRRQTVISELLKADYRRQRQLAETLKIVKSLKAQMTELQRQQGPAKDPAEPELPEEAENGTKRKAHKNYEVKASHRDSPTSHHNSPTGHRPYYHHFGHQVTAVLAARATTRNGDDSHTSGTGAQKERGDLSQWFERMVNRVFLFRISQNCTVENQVKFATCTLMGIALTWWNSHVRTVTNDVAYAMTWTDLKKKMTTKYCPRNEIRRLRQKCGT